MIVNQRFYAVITATLQTIMATNYHSIYPQNLNQEFIDIIVNLYQIENQIKACMQQQNNKLNNLSRECQDSNKSIVRSEIGDRRLQKV